MSADFRPCDACETTALCTVQGACYFASHTEPDRVTMEGAEVTDFGALDLGKLGAFAAQDIHDRDVGSFVQAAADALTEVCHGLAAASGWWGTEDGRIADPRANPLCWSNKLMLNVSELAESMEGDRKGLKDDKLPQYDMRAVEVVDSIIRGFDQLGAFGYDVGEILLAKLRFNSARADHKVTNRVAEGGKAY